MPELIPSNRFLEDIEKFRANPNIRKKVAKTLVYLENDPLHSGLNLERIVNDPTAWSVRVDRKYRISIDPKKHLGSGNPDWSASVTFLRKIGVRVTSEENPDDVLMDFRSLTFTEDVAPEDWYDFEIKGNTRGL